MIGDLVQDQRSRWITLAPTHCPVGHRLGAGQVLVGHVACMGHGGGGHTLWHCRVPVEREPDLRAAAEPASLSTRRSRGRA